MILGVDEVGRGPLAGPVVAAAVLMPADYADPRIKDSKQLSAAQREELVPLINASAIASAIVAVGHHRIHRINIREASRLAMSLAAERVLRRFEPTEILIDGDLSLVLRSQYRRLPQRTVVGGDSLVVQISAASILAKVYRDNLMRVMESRYPGYGFDRHAGYATAAHRQAIAQLGPSPVHRRTFRGVQEWLGSAG